MSPSTATASRVLRLARCSHVVGLARRPVRNNVRGLSCTAARPSQISHDGPTLGRAAANGADLIAPHHPLVPSHLRSVRCHSRKAGKMGHHLETVDDLATRPAVHAARDRRKKKKEQKKVNRHASHDHRDDDDGEEETAPAPSEEAVDLHVEGFANETKFDHGTDDTHETTLLPDSDDVKDRMLRVVTAMEESFRAIRGAEPTPELFEPIQVRAYGTLTPLSSVAQVVIPSPKQATLTCYDPETATAVRDAVRDAGLNFNPRIEEGVVIVPIPKVSMETRKALVKQLGKAAEASRTRVRRIRRAAQDVVKKGKDGKLTGVSEDDAFRAGKEIDAVTEEAIALLNKTVEKKQESVMAV